MPRPTDAELVKLLRAAQDVFATNWKYADGRREKKKWHSLHSGAMFAAADIEAASKGPYAPEWQAVAKNLAQVLIGVADHLDDDESPSAAQSKEWADTARTAFARQCAAHGVEIVRKA